jgi:hypothetical protein
MEHQSVRCVSGFVNRRRVIILFSLAALLLPILVGLLSITRYRSSQFDARSMSSRVVIGYTLPFGNDVVTRIIQDPESNMMRILREQKGVTPVPQWENGCTRMFARGVACASPSRTAELYRYIPEYTDLIDLTDPDALLEIYENAMKLADREQTIGDPWIDIHMDYEDDSAIWCDLDGELVIIWERNPGDAARAIQ